jgi:bifunctional DNA-binding transcriptional regulator/antitoxin component of YhaV-PrlF toxin-antitoxin module
MSRDDDAPSEIREGLNIDESGKAIFEKNEDGSTSIYRETGTGWREYRSGGGDADSGDDD